MAFINLTTTLQSQPTFLASGFKCKACHGASCIDRVVKAPFSSQLLARHLKQILQTVVQACAQATYWRKSPIVRACQGLQVSSTAEVMANWKPSWSPWDANDLIVLFKVVQTGWFQLWKPLLPWPSSLVPVVGELCLLYFLSQQRLFDYFISHCGSVLCPRGIFHLEGPAWAFTQPHVSYEGTLRQMDHQYHVVSPFHLVHSSDFAWLELVKRRGGDPAEFHGYHRHPSHSWKRLFGLHGYTKRYEWVTIPKWMVSSNPTVDCSCLYYIYIYPRLISLLWNGNISLSHYIPS